MSTTLSVITTVATYNYVPRNLGITAISRLRCAFSESRNCVPISTLCTRFTAIWRLECPIQSFTSAESTHLSSVSQLRRSHSASLLCSQIVLTQSQDCKSVLHNLEIGIQFPDCDSVQRNLEISQIPRLRGTYTWIFVVHVLFCCGCCCACSDSD